MVPTPAGGQDLLQPELREPSATGVEARLRVAGGLLVMCALIEGYVSTRDWPFTAKAAVGFGALAVAVSALVDWRELFAASRPRPRAPAAPASR